MFGIKANYYLKKIVTDHHTIAFVGVMFIIMGLINFNEHFFENVLGFKVEIGYGYIFMGIFNILLSVTFLINGISTVENSIGIEEKEPKTNLYSRIENLEKELENLKQNKI